MGWIENLQGEKVGLDTAPFIYFIEENQTYLPVIRPFFEALDRGSFSGITSAVTLLEVLVQPLRLNDEDTAQRYREILLSARNLKTMALSPKIAEKAAKLRATYYLRTPDAIQVSTAICGGASFFLTNDARLAPLSELQVLVLDTLLGNGSFDTAQRKDRGE